MSGQFYFDVGSPYVYLAVSRLPLDDVEWKPISLGGLWKLTGGGSWALTERREAGMAEVATGVLHEFAAGREQAEV